MYMYDSFKEAFAVQVARARDWASDVVRSDDRQVRATTEIKGACPLVGAGDKDQILAVADHFDRRANLAGSGALMDVYTNSLLVSIGELAKRDHPYEEWIWEAGVKVVGEEGMSGSDDEEPTQEDTYFRPSRSEMTAREHVDGFSGFFKGEEPTHEDVDTYFCPEMYRCMFGESEADLPPNLGWDEIREAAHDMIDERAEDA